MKIFLLGEFGFKKGLGHAYRLSSLNFHLSKHFEIYAKAYNDEESAVLTDMNMPISNEVASETDFIIYDGRAITKEKRKFIEKVKFSNRLLIDHFVNIDGLFSKVVIPSFYISAQHREIIVKNFDRHFIGSDYLYFRDISYHSKKKSDILVTFGGSDPNDITSKVAKILQNSATYIVGPLFSRKNISKTLRYVSRDNIVFNPPSTFDLIKKSEITITALGTTLQEVEAQRKKALIISNYADDEYHFQSIRSQSSQPKMYEFLGMYHRLCEGNFFKKLNVLTKRRSAELAIDTTHHNKTSLLNWLEIIK